MNRETPRNDPNLFRASNAEERQFEHQVTMTGIGVLAKLIEFLLGGMLFVVRRFLLSRPRGREIITDQNLGRIQFRAIACTIIAFLVGFYVGHHAPGGSLGPWFMGFLFMIFGPLLAAL
jgi:hypothetical protein